MEENNNKNLDNQVRMSDLLEKNLNENNGNQDSQKEIYSNPDDELVTVSSKIPMAITKYSLILHYIIDIITVIASHKDSTNSVFIIFCSYFSVCYLWMIYAIWLIYSFVLSVKRFRRKQGFFGAFFLTIILEIVLYNPILLLLNIVIILFELI